MSTAMWTVGIDISAQSVSYAWMDAAGDPSRTYTTAQTNSGHQRLISRLADLPVAPSQVEIVMEATSTYWIRLATRLHQNGYRLCVINPVQSAQFAKVLRQHHKTDAHDAQLLARLGRAVDLEAWSPPPAIYEALYQRLQQRDQLVEMRVQMQNRLHALKQRPTNIPSVVARSERLLAELKCEIAALENEIEATIAQDETWAQSAESLLSIPGVGPITAAWILTATLNFATCHSADQASAYAGLVPHLRESGTSLNGKAKIQGGHARLRQALYMAALSASQCNPTLKALYERLRSRGKPPKLARCAVARKLICLGYTLVTRGQVYDPNYGQHPAVALAQA